MSVDDGEFGGCMGGEEGFLGVVEAAEVVEELECGSGEVHDEVGDGWGDGEAGWLGAWVG